MLYKFSKSFNKEVVGISRAAINVLENHEYPGNVRELQNTIERAVALASGNTIEIQDLPGEIIANTDLLTSGDHIPIHVGDTIESAEKKLILATLEYCDNNKRKTAKMLEMSERHLYNKLNQYELDSEEMPLK